MSVYITRINGLSINNPVQYRQQMTTKIAHRLGIREMGIYHYKWNDESNGSLSARIDGIIAGISRGDLVICQFPTGNSLRFERELISHLKAYGGRIVIFLQDLAPLLDEKRPSVLRDVVNLYNQAEVMIIPSLAVRQFLLDNHIRKDMKFVIQEMWDYTIDISSLHTPVLKKECELIDGGGLGGLTEWPFTTTLKLYGMGSVRGGEKLYIVNDMNPEEVFIEISKGGFGLIWYKDLNDRQYMEYNISFSLAKFLAAGIPVVVPVGVSNQMLIEKNHLGLIVHSLKEAVDKIEAMEEGEYQRYVQEIGCFAPALRNGYYTERCLIEAMQALHRKDAGRFSVPVKVYNVGKAVFVSTVLRESFRGNLALSWRFQGNADGFLIYDSAGIPVVEMDNAHQHYCLIKDYGKESSFLVKAYVETLKGKLVVAESQLICLDAVIYGSPKVSLIIPAYNAENYIIRSIDTALAQTLSNLEIIIVDDGSADSTPGICDWYAGKYPNVEVIHQANSGAAAARNTGLEHANGEYISFMDSDDMIYPDMIEKLYCSAKKNNCDISITSVNYITDNDYTISFFSTYAMEENIAVNVDEFMNIYSISAYQFPVVWNKLYRASLAKLCRFPLIIYEDEAWIPYILSYADKICYLNEGLYEHDRSTREDTLSYKCEKRSSDEVFMNHRRAILFYLENGNPIRAEILKGLAQKELSLFAKIYKNVKYDELRKQIAMVNSLDEVADKIGRM